MYFLILKIGKHSHLKFSMSKGASCLVSLTQPFPSSGLAKTHFIDEILMVQHMISPLCLSLLACTYYHGRL